MMKGKAIFVPAIISAAFAPFASAAEIGVRHRLSAGVELPAGQNASSVSVRLKIFVSSHSAQTNFVRPIIVLFDGAPTRGRLPMRLVWEDAACHQRRGYPKITALAVEGDLSAGDNHVEIDAKPRQIGLHIPEDELVTTPYTPAQDTRVDPAIWYFQTRRSGLVFEMKMQSEACVY